MGNIEKTLVFIKPDGVERGLTGDILKRFEQRGIQLRQLELKQLTAEQVDAHYAEHIDKPFYPNLKTYILSGPIALMVLEAEQVISIVRTMVGVTNSAEAAPGTIRGDYALNTQNNIIHASDSVTSAEREIANFF
ncbi:nucleoside-diphosphate kinase [bacterium]|nr:nucleoside-diphosphate kinase [bacterium]